MKSSSVEIFNPFFSLFPRKYNGRTEINVLNKLIDLFLHNELKAVRDDETKQNKKKSNNETNLYILQFFSAKSENI
jgi:hypothetical protein